MITGTVFMIERIYRSRSPECAHMSGGRLCRRFLINSIGATLLLFATPSAQRGE